VDALTRRRNDALRDPGGLADGDHLREEAACTTG
jgi:hypothetical protein